MFTQHNDSNRLIQTEIHITIHMLISSTGSCKGIDIKDKESATCCNW